MAKQLGLWRFQLSLKICCLELVAKVDNPGFPLSWLCFGIINVARKCVDFNPMQVYAGYLSLINIMRNTTSFHIYSYLVMVRVRASFSYFKFISIFIFHPLMLMVMANDTSFQIYWYPVTVRVRARYTFFNFIQVHRFLRWSKLDSEFICFCVDSSWILSWYISALIGVG